MAQLVTLYWRDIPAQVVAEAGRAANAHRPKLSFTGVLRLRLTRRPCVMALTAQMTILLNGAKHPEDCSDALEDEARKRQMHLKLNMILPDWQRWWRRVAGIADFANRLVLIWHAPF